MCCRYTVYISISGDNAQTSQNIRRLSLSCWLTKKMTLMIKMGISARQYYNIDTSDHVCHPLNMQYYGTVVWTEFNYDFT